MTAVDLPGELAPGQVLLRVERFALTANNVTYAVAGDRLNYWAFFPAEDGWGRIPAMGFGVVERTASSAVAVGERFFGFFPMGTHLLIEASPSHEGVVDVSAHRQGISPIYSQYTRTTSDPLYAEDAEDLQLLLRGLFSTSFLIDDFIEDNQRFGATRLLVTSASSKTSIALAFQASRREGLEVVGLTSARNQAFVQELGLYDRVVTYGELEALDAAAPSVFVDMAGNRDVVRRVHAHLGDALRYHAVVGATHWDQGGPAEALPGAEPKLFFAPKQGMKRAQEWGPTQLRRKIAEDWGRFCASVRAWLTVRHHVGAEALGAVYADTLAGRASPRVGNVVSL